MQLWLLWLLVQIKSVTKIPGRELFIDESHQLKIEGARRHYFIFPQPPKSYVKM